MTLRIGSLCSGYGGLDLAVMDVLDAEVAWHAETDPGAAAVLAHHWPEVPNLGDLTAIDWANAEPVDILTAGWPCQPISAAGTGAGIHDERWLFDDIADAIGRMGARPRLLVFENVPRLLTINSGDAMARVVHRLAALGYVGRYGVLSAADVGAPHLRKRVFIVAATDPAGFTQREPADAANSIAGGGDSWPQPGSGGMFAAANADCPGALAELDREPHRPEAHDEHTLVDAPGCVLDWGTYSPAITRWETITERAAPEPAQPAPLGGRRLAARFMEWMQGLEDGHVTAVPGLSYPQQIRALGNGVLPQQGAAALRMLLGGAA